MGGIAGAREAGIEETGVVGGHVEVVLTAGEDSRHHDQWRRKTFLHRRAPKLMSYFNNLVIL